MKYFMSLSLILIFSLQVNHRDINLEKLDCKLLIEIFKFNEVQTILDLEEKKINQVRIITPDSIEGECYDIIINNIPIGFTYGSFTFTYNFNTGIVREVVFSTYKKVLTKKNTYILELLFYEYGCNEVKTDIYSIEFLVKKRKKNNYFVELLQIGLVH